MPHFTVEYTPNIRSHADIPGLLEKAAKIIARQQVFPLAGIRAKALEVSDYYIADGDPAYAFVNATFKIGVGRSQVIKDKVCTELFSMLKEHFSERCSDRHVGLWMELVETPAGWKHNDLHHVLGAKSC